MMSDIVEFSEISAAQQKARHAIFSNDAPNNLLRWINAYRGSPGQMDPPYQLSNLLLLSEKRLLWRATAPIECL